MDQPLTSPSVLRGAAPVRVGCSGWQYRHWRGSFYPDEVAQARWLEFYAGRFDTVELNNSFYRLPERSAFASWRARVPPRFTFAVKASRFLTHMKKLKDPAEPLDRLFSRARALGTKLGPVLYQLPPHWSVDIARLDAFLGALPRGRHVMEFRDPSWYRADVYELLERRQVALCLHDMAGSATGPIKVGPFRYIRFHGTARYAGGYGEDAIERWAGWLAGCAAEGTPVYAYFNNDVGGHAPRDAVRLREAIARRLRQGL